MEKLSVPEKYLYLIASLGTVFAGAVGFYLIYGEPVKKSLVTSGHAHLTGYVVSLILIGYLLRFIDWTKTEKMVLAIWASLTLLAPLTLMYAGHTGVTSMIKTMSILFNGSFVLVWLVMLFALARTKTTTAKK